MADYTTQDMVLRGPLVDDVMRTEPPPPGAVGWAIPDGQGGFIDIGLSDLGDPGNGTPGSPTIIAKAVSLTQARALLNTFDVASNVLYAIEDNTWNAGNGDGLAWVHGLSGGAYAPIGYGYINGVLQLVTIDVVAGTYAPFAGGGPAGTARDPLAVGDDLDVTKAVTDASNTWVDGDLTSYGSPALLDAGAPPAVANQHSSILVGTANVATTDEFDGLDSTGSAWRYRYGRRNDGTSGWTRIPKG